MKKELIKLVRREIRRTLIPTGLIGKRGPAKNIKVLVTKSMKTGFKDITKAALISGREISIELGLTK
jgi:hypothetical protein